MDNIILKRDGRTVPFSLDKITDAIYKAALIVMEEQGSEDKGRGLAEELAKKTIERCERKYQKPWTVEKIQDAVEKTLIENGHAKVAKKYILYRYDRTRARNVKTNLMKTMREISDKSSKDSALKRENANIDGENPMAHMLRCGELGNTEYLDMYAFDPKHMELHEEGFIHKHDRSWANITYTCVQIPLDKLFKGGFHTGHGFLREPNSIRAYAALACIAIQAAQNDQAGGIGVHALDFFLAPGVNKSFWKNFKHYLKVFVETHQIHRGYDMPDEKDLEMFDEFAKYMMNECKKFSNGKIYMSTAIYEPYRIFSNDQQKALFEKFPFTHPSSDFDIDRCWIWAYVKALKLTEDETYQAMEALIHNLNTMMSRAGAQAPFSSINYGTDTSLEGRMVIEKLLLATESGLGKNETPVWPVQIFKLKDGVNYKSSDPNYDLRLLAHRVTAKRIYPNYSNLDASFNKIWEKGDNDYNTQVAYMGCRTRVISNVHDPEKAVTGGRGNLNFTSINLPRLAIEVDIEAQGVLEKGRRVNMFLDKLEAIMDHVFDQMNHRYQMLAQKKVLNFPFVMGQGIWLDSNKLAMTDSVAEVFKHGTLSTGFLGLAEALTMLIGEHHGESEYAQEVGLRIVKFMRDKCDKKSQETGMNYTLLSTPAEGLSFRFTKIDKKKYGEIKGVTDKKYYTNSTHLPVGFKITAAEKIRLEAPYHALCNAGHFSSIQLDGDASQNIEAIEKIINYMCDCDMGYMGLDFPIDRDPCCGYNGPINDVCPQCGRDTKQPEAVMTFNLEDAINEYNQETSKHE